MKINHATKKDQIVNLQPDLHPFFLFYFCSAFNDIIRMRNLKI